MRPAGRLLPLQHSERKSRASKPSCWRADEARRIAANIAKLPALLIQVLLLSDRESAGRGSPLLWKGRFPNLLAPSYGRDDTSLRLRATTRRCPTMAKQGPELGGAPAQPVILADYLEGRWLHYCNRRFAQAAEQWRFVHRRVVSRRRGPVGLLR